MKYLIRVFVIAFIFIPLAQTVRSEPISPDIEHLVAQSKFIFKGTVERLNAATMPSVQVADRTIIVSVNEILHRPKTLGDFTGKVITVRLREPKTFMVGEQAVFFTNVWLYGESIAVQEVANIKVRKDITGIRKKIAPALQKLADQDLKGRISRAALVVVGKVVSARPVPKQGQDGPLTEHAPDWWEAVIQVESVEKGQFPEKRVVVLFPNSTDELWLESPKFHVGQEGIWTLQKDQTEKGPPLLRKPGYTALDSLDFQPKDERERIHGLIKDLR